jgi:hypothetical protein
MTCARGRRQLDFNWPKLALGLKDWVAGSDRDNYLYLSKKDNEAGCILSLMGVFLALKTGW